MSHQTFHEVDTDTLGKFKEKLGEMRRKLIGSPSRARRKSTPGVTNHSHAFILNKALQEILLDYNWDGPDMSSPVKKTKLDRTKKCSKADDTEDLNFVFVFTSIPCNVEEMSTFTGKDIAGASDFLRSVLDTTSLKGFRSDKNLRLHFVNTSSQSVQGNLLSVFQHDLAKVNGNVHSIDDLVQRGMQQVSFRDSFVSILYALNAL